MATRKKSKKASTRVTKKAGRKGKAGGVSSKKRATRKKNGRRSAATSPVPAPAAAEVVTQPVVSANPEVFEALAAILTPYAHLFEAEMQPGMGYCLKTYGEWPSEIYFAGVQWTEAGVYYHLFPALRHPQLFDGIGPGLRGHLEGKLSFRFEALEPELLEELGAVTETAFQCLRGEGLFRDTA